MRGFGTAIAALFKLLLSLGIPSWAILVVVGGALYWFVPKVVEGINKDRARRLLKEHRLDAAADRAKAEATALDIAGEDPHTLVIVATQAIEDGRTKLAQETLERLRKTGARRRDLGNLEERLYGPLPAVSIEAAIRIEKLIESGMTDKALQLAQRSCRKWPDDTELADLLEQCSTSPVEADGPTMDVSTPAEHTA